MNQIYEILKLHHDDVLRFLAGGEINPVLFEELYIHYFETIPLSCNTNVRNYIAGLFYIDCQAYWSTINRSND